MGNWRLLICMKTFFITEICVKLSVIIKLVSGEDKASLLPIFKYKQSYRVFIIIITLHLLELYV